MSVGLKANSDGSGAVQTGGTDAIQISTSQAVTFPNTANLPNTFGFKNRIINGAMVIDQRNAGASVTPTNGQYTLDRFSAGLTQASKFTVQQSSTAPSGFSKSLLVTSSSAYSITSTDLFYITQPIEGQNIIDLAWGTASASAVTLSFQVRSSLTGTFGGSIVNSGASRSYPFTYSIASANTWTTISVTIPGDTTGTWLTTNGVGMYVFFGLGAGSTLSGTAGSWAGAAYYSATGATSVVGTNGATFYITGVQLEKGSTATSFDYRPYGTELSLCQRYYYRVTPGAVSKPITQVGWNAATSSALSVNKFPVTMRIAPTALEQSGTANQYAVAYLSTLATCTAVPVFSNATTENSLTNFQTAAVLTAGQAIIGYTDSTNGATAYLGWSAEL